VHPTEEIEDKAKAEATVSIADEMHGSRSARVRKRKEAARVERKDKLRGSKLKMQTPAASKASARS
jgi:hypothetical protein